MHASVVSRPRRLTFNRLMQNFLEDAKAKGAVLALDTQVTGGKLSGIPFRAQP